MEIYCCGCEKTVDAVRVTGKDVYPHITDLKNVPFWKCLTCLNFVGMHYKSNRGNRTEPLGTIPTKEIKSKRSYLHSRIDPIWNNKLMKRKEVYAYCSEYFGKEFHIGHLSTDEEFKLAYMIVDKLCKHATDLKVKQILG